jgi:predicted GNAT family N-acyltransferase
VTPHRDHELTRTEVREILRLVHGVWPADDRPERERVQSFIDRARKQVRQGSADRALRYVVWDGNRAIANGKTFTRMIKTEKGPLQVMARMIKTEKGPLQVMALSCVCVASERRGEGLGKAIVLEAFRRVDDGKFAVSLFQTSVPAFYEKLGARVVENRFCNRLDENDPEGNPWMEPYAMIYPASFDWPDGTIDINGPRY